MTITQEPQTGSTTDAEVAGSRWARLVRPDRVHRAVYTDPGIFAEEMEVVFGQTWVYVAHESELPAPNDFVTRKLGLRPVIVTRDRAGTVHVLANRCTHRAATVCRSDSGTAKSFTCPYHGWTFRNDGALTGVPWPEAWGPQFSKAELGLREVTSASYRGFVFATLAEDPIDLRTHLGRAARYLDAWLDRLPGSEVVVRNGVNRMTYRGNWKLAYDNAGDGYHPAFSHRSLLKMAGRTGDDKDMTYFGTTPDSGPMYAQSLGRGHTFLDQRPSYDGRGAFWRQQRPAPGREELEALVRAADPDRADALLDATVGAQMNLNIFPNLLVIGNQIQVVEPLAVDHTQLTWWSTTLTNVPDEVNVLRMRHQEDFPAFGEPDDQVNFEEAQKGLAFTEEEWVLLDRGYGVPGRQTVDADGVETGPVTDELTIRGYFAEWKRLMEEGR